LNDTFTDRLVYVSNRAYQEALADRSTPAQRSVVIPNGIDLTKFQQPYVSAHLREQHATPEDALVLTYLGRLDEQKGVDDLLQALAMLEPEPETKILAWIIGSGPEREKLHSLGQTLGIGEMVRFIGHQENVADLLQASDLFVLPSHSEGMSIALLEALAAGLPCVVTDVGDNALVVADGVQGRVVPPGQPQAIAQAIQALVRDGGLRRRMGEQAREKALEYSDVSMAQQVEALYGQLA
jgi:glycosyltransferase involved in cell wall biosynthesis